MKKTGIIAAALAFVHLAPLTAQAQSVDNSVYVQQIGDMAHAVTDRGAAVIQSGNDNRGHVVQNTPYQTGVIVQTGEGHLASLTQTGPAANIAVLLQAGSGNEASVTQSAVASQNVAVVTQNGTGNRAELAQTGSDNAAVLTQVGNDNLIQAAQTGDNNALVWTQVGSNLAQPRIEMDGNQNIAISQTGWK